MTSRQARRERREAERKAKKAEWKRLKAEGSAPSAHHGSFNPELEDEFSRELQMEMNAIRDRIHRDAGLDAPNLDPAQPLAGAKTQTTQSRRAKINRQNAQHSTGPRSIGGKLASSRNSLKHGLSTGQVLIPGEDPAAFESLRNDLIQEHQPANATEELLVIEMAQSFWLTQRAIRLQNECFTDKGLDEKRLALFLRYQTTHERAFHKALNTLLKLKRSRAREQADFGFVSQRTDKSPAEDGFVSQSDPNPACSVAEISDHLPKTEPLTGSFELSDQDQAA